MSGGFTIEILEEKKKKGKIRDYTVMGVQTPKKKSKYGNEKTEYAGKVFDSKKEMNRYKELLLLLKVGKIGLLETQKVFDLVVNDVIVARYKSDFAYLNEDGQMVVEDVKSVATRKIATYRLKKKLMLQIHKIEIAEI